MFPDGAMAKSYNTIRELRPDHDHFTSYSLYRTQDISPYLETTGTTNFGDIRFQSKTEFYGLVDDIPVCKMFYATVEKYEPSFNVTAYRISFTSGVAFTENDVGNLVYWTSGASSGVLKLTAVTDNSKLVVTKVTGDFPVGDSYAIFGHFCVKNTVSVSISNHVITERMFIQ
jgi:hypothetical protein